MGPTTPPRKISLATETEIREKTAPGDRREAKQATGFMKDGDQTRKEVFDGASPDTQNFYQHRNLECENTISDRKTGTCSPGNASIQNQPSGYHGGLMDWSWKTTTGDRRHHTLVRQRGQPVPTRSSPDHP